MSVWHEQMANKAWLIGVSGRLDQKQTLELEAELMDLLAEGHSRFLVDLSDVTYVNSGGLRCLVTVWRQSREKGGNVSLCGLTPRVEQVFLIVGFDKVFQIYSDREDAKRAFNNL
jgi:anti-sigma B factor antagonist